MGASADSWFHAGSLRDLECGASRVVRVGRKQILLLRTEDGLHACNNRCPHEGYPLKEGSVSDGCVLTCNWHNWKFDLESGETLVGGDRLRRYPLRLEGDEIWLDLTDPPGEARAAAALDALKDSFRRMEYDRMARELARLAAADADPLQAVRAAVLWTHDRFEYGTTHAIAAAPDWLALRDAVADDDAERLVPLLEVVAHLAWDSLREPQYPFPEETAPYSERAFVEAIKQEDEGRAIALLRGALGAGKGLAALEQPLATVALAHYADFGHSLIYVYKTGQLVARLGRESEPPLLLALVRSLIYAYREDLIPEFRAYGKTLDAWGNEAAAARSAPEAADFTRRSVHEVLDRARMHSSDPEGLFAALFGASAWNLLHFDRRKEGRTEGPVSQNVGWLTFTHALTFGNAVRALCGRYPELWPRGLLQMACFVGRNAADVDTEQDLSPWRVEDPEAFFKDSRRRLLDHGQFEYIVVAHLIKTLAAAREEYLHAPTAPWVEDLLAGVNRFINTPIKRRHSLRTARQSIDFVAAEG